MSSENHPPVPGDFSSGPLGKAVGGLAWVLVTTLMLALTAVPSFLLTMFIHPEHPAAFTNALVLTAALALLGPAISAGMYSARAHTIDEDPKPFKAFWRGYRMNFFDVLRIWFPVSLIIGLLTLSIGVATVTGMGLGNIALFAILGAVAVWGLLALTLATFISMRPGGIARLAVLYIGRTWKVTLGIIGIGVIIFLLTRLPGGIFLIPIFSAILVALLYVNAKPMIADATEHWTVNAAAPHDIL